MEIQENHRLKILNAKCEYVNIASTLVKKMNYGENVDCCINKLYLASRLINRLECYCFSETSYSTTTNGSFTASFNRINTQTDGVYYLYSEGSAISSYTSEIENYDEIVRHLLELAGLSYTRSIAGETGVTYIASTDCSIPSLSIVFLGSTVITFTETKEAVCILNVSECYNCIEDSNLYEMYAVLDQLLS